MQTASFASPPYKRRLRSKKLIAGLLGAAFILPLLTLSWFLTPLGDIVSVERLTALFQPREYSAFTFVWVTALYILCTLAFIPVSLLTTAVILTFGGVGGVLITMVGATISSIIGYSVGYWLGAAKVRNLTPRVDMVLDKIRHASIIGVAAIRMVPLAPFSMVNLTFGISGISLLDFAAGTVLGMLPGKLVLAFLGQSVFDVLQDPDRENLIWLALGFLAWVTLIYGCNRLARQWHSKHPTTTS